MHRPQDDVVPLHEPFETALRGFNRQQVLAYIESLDGRVSMVTADRESALAQVAELSRTIDHLRAESELLAYLRRAAEKANEQVELMAQAPIVGASARIQRIVRLAEEEAAELRARAVRETDELKARAMKEADELKARAGKEVTELRARAEQEVEREITRREREAADRIRTRVERRVAGLQLMLKIVGPQLAERMATVERAEAELTESRTRAAKEVATLEAIRDKVTAQLRATRQVLAGTLEPMQQTTVDAPEPAHHPVPIQRDGRLVGQHGVQSGPAQLVPDSRADESR